MFDDCLQGVARGGHLTTERPTLRWRKPKHFHNHPFLWVGCPGRQCSRKRSCGPSGTPLSARSPKPCLTSADSHGLPLRSVSAPISICASFLPCDFKIRLIELSGTRAVTTGPQRPRKFGAGNHNAAANFAEWMLAGAGLGEPAIGFDLMMQGDCQNRPCTAATKQFLQHLTAIHLDESGSPS